MNRAVNDIIVAVLIIVIMVCGWKVLPMLYGYLHGSSQYKTVSETYFHKGVVRFDRLQKKYPDCKAWIYQKGTGINYPVMQRKGDNQYYLHHLYNGEYNFKGSIYIDKDNLHPFLDPVTILYGHRMRDRTMFWSIHQYANKGYWKKHKTMTIYTKNQDYRVKIFAMFYLESNDKAYQNQNIQGYEDREKYLLMVKKRSILHTKVKVSPSDPLVLLSTCQEASGTHRIAVFGKLVPLKYTKKERKRG